MNGAEDEGSPRDRTVPDEDVPSTRLVASAEIKDRERGRESKRPKKGKEDMRALRYFESMLGLF